jgi:hypothetical protein
LSVEVNLATLSFDKQNDLLAKEHYSLIMDNIDEVADRLLMALNIEKAKFLVAITYNKKVWLKGIQVGNLV